MPVLKPPGTKRSKLDYDTLVSNSAFKFNLRRYIKGGVVLVSHDFRLIDQARHAACSEQALHRR
jgi:hypothetical protein